MLTRVAHVRVDEQRALAKLCKHGCQIGREPAAPLAALRAGDRENPPAGVVEPAQDQLAAQRPQGLDGFALRHIAGDEIVRGRRAVNRALL